MAKPLDLDVDLDEDWDFTVQPGRVSSDCCFSDTDGVRFVRVREVVAVCYDLADRNTERAVWVQLHRAGHATQGQIARALGLGLRTVNGWVRRYRDQGVAGLIDRPLTGRRANPEKAALIRQYRQAGQKLTDIARLVNVSLITVKRVLARERENPELAQQALVAPATVSSAVVATPAAASSSEPVLEAIPSESEPALASSQPGVDPMDRSRDRVMARIGLLDDAEPVFASGGNLPWVGAFLALALMGDEPLLPVAHKLWASLGAAFYGVRTTLVTLLLLALLRVKRPEQIRGYDAAGLARILGLDRAPEVKTLRRKLHALSSRNQGMPFLEKLALARVQALNAKPSVVYLDGHVSVYSGQSKIGEVYSTRDKRVVKGTTQTWVNLPGRTPLFCMTSEFNEGLVAALPSVLKKAAEVCASKSLTVVFDRGGYSGLGFEKLLDAGYQFITYRRGETKPWPLDQFKKVPTRIGERQYDYAPAEQAVEIAVYEPGPAATAERGAPRNKNTGRKVTAREIRVLRQDGGQTALLVSDPHLPVIEACAVLFGRWGAQENVFKYLIAEYDLDATVEYGEEELSAELLHPNPEYSRRQRRIASLAAQRDRILGKLGIKLLAPGQAQDPLKALLAEWAKKPAGKKALKLQDQIQTLRGELTALPQRVPAKTDGFCQLKSQMKMLTTGVKLSAYYLETKLLDMVAPFYPNHAKEGRKLILAALKSSGSIRLRPGEIRVRLDRQSAPCRTRAIAQLCEELNQLNPIYPGTTLRIIFDPPVL